MLAGAVDAGKGLLVQQADEAVARRHTLHRFHGELVLVDRDVAGAVDGRALVLRRRDLIVLRRGGDAHFPQLLIQVGHELAHALADDAEILILQFLSLGRGRAEERPSGVDEVTALEVALAVDDEILLLRADGDQHALGILIAEQAQDAHRLLGKRLHGAKQRRFVVQRLAVVGNEHRRDAQDGAAGHLLDKGRGGHIPSGITSGVVRRAQAAGGETGGVRLAHDELLAGQIQNDLAHFVGRGQEGVMLFRGHAGQRLEPVGVVGRALLDRPFHHCLCHDIRRLHGDLAAAGDHLLHLTIYIRRQTLTHHRIAEHIGAEVFGNLHLFPSPFAIRR